MTPTSIPPSAPHQTGQPQMAPHQMAPHQMAPHQMGQQPMGQHGMMQMSYRRFGAMVATATAVMFALMYSTVYRWGDVWWSQTRFWMALYMGATMAVIMLAFMLAMYRDRRTNAAIFAGSAVLFAVALWLARSQATVGDVAWMKAMIPHHSIAILTSERARITDPRVRRLADEIIAGQVREIREMELLLEDIDRNGRRGNTSLPARPAVVTPDMGPTIREAVQ